METKLPVLLIDGALGINIPAYFYENFDLDKWGLNPKDYLDLINPDTDAYWDSWDDLIAEASYLKDGETYRLYQYEGDLFAVPESLSDDEHEKLFP